MFKGKPKVDISFLNEIARILMLDGFKVKTEADHIEVEAEDRFNRENPHQMVWHSIEVVIKYDEYYRSYYGDVKVSVSGREIHYSPLMEGEGPIEYVRHCLGLHNSQCY